MLFNVIGCDMKRKCEKDIEDLMEEISGMKRCYRMIFI